MEHLYKKHVRPVVMNDLFGIVGNGIASRQARLVGTYFGMFHHTWVFPSDEQDHTHTKPNETYYCPCDELLHEWLPAIHIRYFNLLMEAFLIIAMSHDPVVKLALLEFNCPRGAPLGVKAKVGRPPFAKRMVVKVARELYEDCGVNQMLWPYNSHNEALGPFSEENNSALFPRIAYKRQDVPTSDTYEAAAPKPSTPIKRIHKWTIENDYDAHGHWSYKADRKKGLNPREKARSDYLFARAERRKVTIDYLAMRAKRTEEVNKLLGDAGLSDLASSEEESQEDEFDDHLVDGRWTLGDVMNYGNPPDPDDDPWFDYDAWVPVPEETPPPPPPPRNTEETPPPPPP